MNGGIETLRVELDDRGYDILVGPGLIATAGAHIRPLMRRKQTIVVTDETIARYSREHNGTNVMTLGSTLLPDNQTAIRLVEVWLGTPMTEARYIRRLLKISRLEESF